MVVRLRSAKRCSVPVVPTVEVFADVCCPFAHVGLRLLTVRREQLGRSDLHIRVRAWPLELVNGSPLDPAVVAKEIEALKHLTAPFAHFNPNCFPATSLPAFDLAELAYQQGLDVGERVSLALRNALFEDGLDIGEPAVVRHVGTTFGLSTPGPGEREAVVRDWQAGKERGVEGSPHVFCGVESAFCPSLDISKDDGRLRVTVNQHALNDLLASCFGD